MKMSLIFVQMTGFTVRRFWGLLFRSEGHPWPVPRSSLALVTPKQSPKPQLAGSAARFYVFQDGGE